MGCTRLYFFLFSSLASASSLQDILTVHHDGAWREEIEIELRDQSNESYNGTITMQEAKYDIFRDCLGFKDFKNFDGVRFTFKGI